MKKNVKVSVNQLLAVVDAGFSVDEIVSVVRRVLSSDSSSEDCFEEEFEGLNYDRETHECLRLRLCMPEEIEVQANCSEVNYAADRMMTMWDEADSENQVSSVVKFFCTGIAGELEHVSSEGAVGLFELFRVTEEMLVFNEVGYYG